MPNPKHFYPVFEAVLFSSPQPVSAKNFFQTLGELTEQEIPLAVEFLNGEYEREGRPFRIVEVAGGYRMETQPRFAPYLEKFFRNRIPQKLTRASLETLSIIAYRQPITKAELDAIRGIQSDGPVHTLLERGLIAVMGKGESIGKPRLYGTTNDFLRYMGLKSLAEMPEPDDVKEFFHNWEAKNKGYRNSSGGNDSASTGELTVET